MLCFYFRVLGTRVLSKSRSTRDTIPTFAWVHVVANYSDALVAKRARFSRPLPASKACQEGAAIHLRLSEAQNC